MEQIVSVDVDTKEVYDAPEAANAHGTNTEKQGMATVVQKGIEGSFDKAEAAASSGMEGLIAEVSEAVVVAIHTGDDHVKETTEEQSTPAESTVHVYERESVKHNPATTEADKTEGDEIEPPLHAGESIVLEQVAHPTDCDGCAKAIRAVQTVDITSNTCLGEEPLQGDNPQNELREISNCPSNQSFEETGKSTIKNDQGNPLTEACGDSECLPANREVSGTFGVPIDAPRKSSQESAAAESGEFFNHGLALWEKSRRDWLGPRSDTDSKVAAVPVDVDEIIDVLFATPKQIREWGGPRKFPQPVGLPQMIDLLIDLWEAEGLDT